MGNLIEIKRIEIAISLFSTKMFEKMRKKFRQGWRGWEKEEIMPIILQSLDAKIAQIKKGDYSQCVDAANFLMMIDRIKNES